MIFPCKYIDFEIGKHILESNCGTYHGKTIIQTVFYPVLLIVVIAELKID